MTIPRKRFRTIGASIEKIVKPIFGRRGFGAPTIVNDWPNIVGPILAKHTIPEKISYPGGSRLDGTLQLRIASSALALELQHLDRQLREKINSHFGYRAIGRIRIIQGPVPEMEKETNIRKRPLSRSEHDELARKLDIISDPELRKVLSALGSAIIQDTGTR